MAASCAPQRPVFESRSRRVIRSTIVGPTNTAGERDKTEGDMEATDISIIPELAKSKLATEHRGALPVFMGSRGTSLVEIRSGRRRDAFQHHPGFAMRTTRALN
jgi:hypothetical protein